MRTAENLRPGTIDSDALPIGSSHPVGHHARGIAEDPFRDHVLKRDAIASTQRARITARGHSRRAMLLGAHVDMHLLSTYEKNRLVAGSA